MGLLVSVLYDAVFGSQYISHFPSLKPLLSDIVILLPFAGELEVDLLLSRWVVGRSAFARHDIVGEVPIFAFLY